MARIQLEHVRKTFTKGKVVALDDVNLDVKDNEFFVLFGPAGAGKTTILNNIAGIQIPEEGVVKIDGEIVNTVDPAHRNTAMVFENYALYPQMTVYDNMASPLRSKLYHEEEDVIKRKVQHAAEIMKMENLLERLPSQLSNGQKQRVAMGRALVRTPNVFLMDEPLAHLDAKLRNSMRTELKEIQANFNTTTIYVTHDFMEAMSLGDRIGIVDQGKIIQVGTGYDVYYMHCNEFVSQLMGDPEINIIPVSVAKEGDKYTVTMENGDKFVLPEDETVYQKLTEEGVESVDMALRPQNVSYSFEPTEGAIKGTVYTYESIGNKSVIEAAIGKDLKIRMIAPNGLNVELDQDVYVSLDVSHAMFFYADTKEYMTRYGEAVLKQLSAEQLAKQQKGEE